jgi:hypothetical protein
MAAKDKALAPLMPRLFSKCVLFAPDDLRLPLCPRPPPGSIS